MPRIYRVVVPVRDMPRADEFYSQLLSMPPDPVVPTRHYFDCDGVLLACVDPSEHGGTFRANPDIIYFAVRDLETTYERAKRAGAGEMDMSDPQLGGNGIATRPWGERSFYCRDPFGNPLCFVDATTLFTGSRER
jgi:catechol 2,3-dioxygenase-like lactoylglutathione lyase family enzyme